MMLMLVSGLLRTLLGLMGGDSNLYRYVLGDPVNLIDPTGGILELFDWCRIRCRTRFGNAII